MDQKPAIRQFLKDLLATKGDSLPFSDSDSLLLSGRLQSLDAVEVVVFLEEKFAVDFAAVGFDQEKIDSVGAIASLVEAARGQSTSSAT
ncbi:MAG: acyl carrier protein [Candidatus Acidiferrum sp.]